MLEMQPLYSGLRSAESRGDREESYQNLKDPDRRSRTDQLIKFAEASKKKITEKVGKLTKKSTKSSEYQSLSNGTHEKK